MKATSDVQRLRRALKSLRAEGALPKSTACVKLLLAAEEGKGLRLTAEEVAYVAGTFEVEAHGEQFRLILTPEEEARIVVDELGQEVIRGAPPCTSAIWRASTSRACSSG